MESYLFCKTNHLPHRLNEKEIASPKSVLRDYFSAAHLSYWRYTLWLWLNLVTTTGFSWPKLNPKHPNVGELHHAFGLLEKLLEACSLLAQPMPIDLKGKNRKKHIGKVMRGRESPKLVEIRDRIHVILFLSDDEISNPYLVFTWLFRHYSLDEWRYLLNEWLSMGLSNHSNEGEFWHNDTLYCYASLVRATEACFLINELENRVSD